MAKLGTVFVELSLDDKVYKQKLSEIKPNAEATVKGLETSWKVLGSKTNEYFDSSRRAAENAYGLILRSGKYTADELVRAEQAKAARIAEINRQQYGRIKSTIEGTYAAATNAVNTHHESMAALTRTVLRLYAAYYVVSTGVQGFVSFIKQGVEAIDSFNLATVKNAAIMTGMMKSDGRSLPERYKEAYQYAGQLNKALEEVDKNTMLNFQQLQDITTEMMKQGVVLNTNNKAEIAAFTQISNALATIAAGAPNKEIQLRQEIRALLQGEVRATDQLAQMIDAQLNGKLKEQIALHKKNGDLVMWLGEQLKGFGAAQDQINASWETAKSTLQTTYNQVLREGFQKAFVEIVAGAKKLSDWAIEHKREIGEIISGGWNLISGAVSGTITGVGTLIDVTRKFKDEILAVGAGILAMQLPALLTTVIGLVKELTIVVGILGTRIAYAFGPIGLAVGGIVYMFEKLGRSSAVDAQIARLEQMKQKANITAAELGQVNAQLAILYKRRGTQAGSSSNIPYDPTEYANRPINPPVFNPKIDTKAAEDAAKELDKLKEKWEQTAATLRGKIEMAGLDESTKEFVKNRLEAEKLRKEFAGLPKDIRATAYALIETNKQADDFAQIAKQDQKAIEDLTKAQQKGVDEYAKNEQAYNSLADTLGPLRGIQRQYLADLETIAKAEAAGIATEQEAAALRLKLLTERDGKFADYEKRKEEQLVNDLGRQADYYKDLIGFEDKYHQKMMDYIEARRKADIKAGVDVAAANAKAKKSQMQLSSDAFYKENADRAAAFSSMASNFAAAAQLYAEDSRERKALSEASKIATIAEMAVIAQKNLMIAVGAVVQQGTGDPYSAFARMAAMIAFVTGILSIAGIAFGGGSSGADAPEPEYKPASTVLGAAAGTASESISKSWEMMQDQYDMEYRELTNIYNELKNLNDNITGLVASIFRTGSLESSSTGIKLPQNQASPYASFFPSGPLEWGDKLAVVGGQILQKLFNSLLEGIFGGEVEYNFSGVSIQLFSDRMKDLDGNIVKISASIQNLRDGFELTGRTFQIVQEIIDGGWFGDDERNWWIEYGKLDSDVEHMFTLVFKNLGNTLVELATGLGYDTAATLAYVFDLSKFPSISGKDSDEVNELISAWMNGIADTAVDKLFGEFVRGYQKVEEGLYETAVRLVTDAAIVKNVLELTGQSFTGGAQEMIAFSESLIKMAGDLDTLKESASKYYDAFYTDSEKQVRLTETLTGILSDQEMILPENRESWKLLVESLDITTESGMQAYLTLLNLSESADAYYSHLEDLESSRQNMTVQLLTAQGKDAEALALKRKLELEAMDESLRPLQQLIWAYEDQATAATAAQTTAKTGLTDATTALNSAFAAAKTALTDAYNTELKVMQDNLSKINEVVSTLTGYVNKLKSSIETLKGSATDEAAQYSRAQKELQSVLTAARKGDFSGIETLDSALSILTGNSADMYSTQVDYLKQQRKTLNAITELENLTSDQLSTEEIQQALIEDQIATLKSNHESQLAALDAQLNAILGLNTTVMSIADAIGAYNKANDIVKGQTPEAQALLSEIGRAQAAWYEYTAAGRNDLADLAHTYAEGLRQQLALMGVAESVYAQVNDLRTLWSGYGTEIAGHYDITQPGAVPLPGFADGGDFAGGWRTVGENGPEIEYTGPSHIFSNRESKGLIDLSEVVKAVNRLESRLDTVVKHTAKTADNTEKLDEWNEIGLPPTQA